MYTVTNFKTKKALKEAVQSGEEVIVFQPGPFKSQAPMNGRVSLEGPHAPQPHTWYAEAFVENSIIKHVL